jgi:hypothetical protein
MGDGTPKAENSVKSAKSLPRSSQLVKRCGEKKKKSEVGNKIYEQSASDSRDTYTTGRRFIAPELLYSIYQMFNKTSTSTNNLYIF